MKCEWEISIMELKDNGKKFKVTRRMPALAIAETKLFSSKEQAREQCEAWLQESMKTGLQ